MHPNYRDVFEQVRKESIPRSRKNRFLARVGQRLFFVTSEDIAYFQADNKIVHLIDRKGNRYVVNYTMEQLEELLDPAEFFRMSRKFIVKMSAIEQVKPYYNNRLKLSVTGAPQQEELVISRERVANFKQWAEA
jgi:DNA-binding LytR/AlgR family response regulator